MIVITRKERDRQIRRQDIFRAAEHIFAHKGYHRATMQDIARQAQYATGTVYLYFKDKESLYFSLIEVKIKALVGMLKEKTARIDDAAEKFAVFVEGVLDYFEKNEDFFRIFVAEHNRLQWSIEAKNRQVHIDGLPFLAELIKTGQRQGYIRDDYSADAIADIFHSVFTTVIYDWLKQKQPSEGPKKLAGFILAMFLQGALKR